MAIELDQAIETARKALNTGPNTTYPSRNSATYVRKVLADLVDAVGARPTERDPVRAALADEIAGANLVTMHHWNAQMGWDDETELTSEGQDVIVAALNAPLPGRLDCGEPVAWQMRPRGSFWQHCDIVTNDPDIEFRPLYALPPTLNSGAAGEPVAWQPGKSIEDRARDLLEVEFKNDPAQPTMAALRAVAVALRGELKCIDALRAVWDDWITANDESGMDEYEVKDTSPETVQKVQSALRGRIFALPRAVDGGAAGEREAAIHDALLGLIEAVELDSDEGGKGISGYTAARLTDARAALLAVHSRLVERRRAIPVPAQSQMTDLEAAQAIAAAANECCYRSDGWEEHIAEIALKTISSLRAGAPAQEVPDLDEVALSATLEIEQLDWGHPTQRTAGIQKIIAQALRGLANRSSPAAAIGDIQSEPRPPASAAMGLSAGGDSPFRAGDSVLHGPSGETWVVAYVDGEYMAWCGWPEGEAQVRDCTLVTAVSDTDHIAWLVDIAKANGKRGRKARAALEAMIECREDTAASWCKSHQRRMTHTINGKPHCDPALGGIMLPCAVDPNPPLSPGVPGDKTQEADHVEQSTRGPA